MRRGKQEVGRNAVSSDLPVLRKYVTVKIVEKRSFDKVHTTKHFVRQHVMPSKVQRAFLKQYFASHQLDMRLPEWQKTILQLPHSLRQYPMDML